MRIYEGGKQNKYDKVSGKIEKVFFDDDVEERTEVHTRTAKLRNKRPSRVFGYFFLRFLGHTKALLFFFPTPNGFSAGVHHPVSFGSRASERSTTSATNAVNLINRFTRACRVSIF